MSVKRRAPNNTSQSAPKIPFHLMQMESSSTSATMAPQPQKRKLPRRVLTRTRESTPSKFPGLLRSHTHEMGLTPRLGTSKKPQEHQRLRGPATADLSGQNNQATATAWCDELRIGSLLSSSRCGQTKPIHVGSTNVESAITITVQSRHNRGVYRQLCPAMERQPVRDNFKSATILHVHGLQIQVARHNVGGHSGAGLTAHPGSSTLDRKAPSCQHPCTSTSCTVVAKSVIGTATPAEAPCEGEWEPETAE